MISFATSSTEAQLSEGCFRIYRSSDESPRVMSVDKTCSEFGNVSGTRMALIMSERYRWINVSVLPYMRLLKSKQTCD